MQRPPVQALAAVAVCSGLWIAFGSLIVPTAKRHDFLNLYTGASLALDGNFEHMHSPEVQLAREREFVPDLPELVPFVRPAFYAALLAPLALVPYATAFWVWLVFQSVLLVGCWIWAYRRWGGDALITGALFLPSALGIAHGQDCVFMLLIAIGFYSFAEKENWYKAGAMLGLGLIKFHLWLAWPFALLVLQNRCVFSGAALTIGIEAAVTALLSRAEGLRTYFALLQNKQLAHLSPSPDLMIDVQSLALNLFHTANPALITALIVTVAALAAIALWHAPLWRLVAVAATASLLIAPHVYGYDAALLLLPLWAVFFSNAPLMTRALAIALITPLPYMLTLGGSPWAAATPLVLLAFLASLAFARQKPSQT